MLLFHHKTQNRMFHRVAYDFDRADWDGLRDHSWEDIFKLAAASEFCEWVQPSS